MVRPDERVDTGAGETGQATVDVLHHVPEVRQTLRQELRGDPGRGPTRLGRTHAVVRQADGTWAPSSDNPSPNRFSNPAPGRQNHHCGADPAILTSSKLPNKVLTSTRLHLAFRAVI